MRRGIRFLISDRGLLVLGLIGVVIIAIVTTLFVETGNPRARSRSTGTEGTLALRRWLQASDYEVREVVSRSSYDDFDTLLILEPAVSYSSTEAAILAEWVRDGGTAIIASDGQQINDILQSYEVQVGNRVAVYGQLVQASPTLETPLVDSIQFFTAQTIETERRDVTVHFVVNKRPVVVSFREQHGQVWVVSGLNPFTNSGLHHDGNAQFVMNLLVGQPENAIIGFDESLRGFTERPDSLFHWLTRTTPGWGILSGVVITMVFLGLRGRRFGKAMPRYEDTLRRESVEYVHAMSHLMRVSGQREDTLAHYRQFLRRHLIKRYGVSPNLNDDDLVTAICDRDARVDGNALRLLLERLSKPNVSESELVAVAYDVDNWIRTHS